MGIKDLQIKLPATAANIARVRGEVESQANRLGMASAKVADLKTVVSEACTNVVRYAYERGEQGPLEVLLRGEGEELSLIVRDFGAGISPRPDTALPSLHLGLSIIGALSSSFRLSSTRGAGTELEIWMPMDSASAPS